MSQPQPAAREPESPQEFHSMTIRSASSQTRSSSQTSPSIGETADGSKSTPGTSFSDDGSAPPEVKGEAPPMLRSSSVDRGKQVASRIQKTNTYRSEPDVIVSEFNVNQHRPPKSTKSKYPPGIESILRRDRVLSEEYTGDFGRIAGLRMPAASLPDSASPLLLATAESIFTSPRSQPRPPTPISPRSVSPVHQQPGSWSRRGARNAIENWIRDLYALHGVMKTTLKREYGRWLFRDARRLLSALKDLATTLEKFLVVVDIVPASALDHFEMLDSWIKQHLTEGYRIYEAVTLHAEPVTDEAKSIQKRSIKRDLGPQMYLLAEQLVAKRKESEALRKGFDQQGRKADGATS